MKRCVGLRRKEEVEHGRSRCERIEAAIYIERRGRAERLGWDPDPREECGSQSMEAGWIATRRQGRTERALVLWDEALAVNKCQADYVGGLVSGRKAMERIKE
jgi:hypothetical protein